MAEARKLYEREKGAILTAHKSALDAYQPRETVAALRMADELDGRGASTYTGRANLERWSEALEYLRTRGVKLGFMQKQLTDIAQVILAPRMFGDSFAAEKRYLHTLSPSCRW